MWPFFDRTAAQSPVPCPTARMLSPATRTIDTVTVSFHLFLAWVWRGRFSAVFPGWNGMRQTQVSPASQKRKYSGLLPLVFGMAYPLKRQVFSAARRQEKSVRPLISANHETMPRLKYSYKITMYAELAACGRLDSRALPFFGLCPERSGRTRGVSSRWVASYQVAERNSH